MVVDDSFSQSTFLLSKLVPTTYERIATMGTATLWKLIMLAWSYENNLAIPDDGIASFRKTLAVHPACGVQDVYAAHLLATYQACGAA